MLSFFDITLVIMLSGFVFYGLFFGLIRVIGGIFGTIFGAILASRYYLQVYDYLQNLFLGNENFGKILSFIIAFVVIRKIIVLIFSVLNTAFNIISIIPFITTINRLFGAIFGFLEGSLILGLIIFVASRYTIAESLIGVWISGSQITPWLLKITSILIPFLPDALKMINALV